jgi:hypothetical protein
LFLRGLSLSNRMSRLFVTFINLISGNLRQGALIHCIAMSVRAILTLVSMLFRF